MKPKTTFANGQNPFLDCPVGPVLPRPSADQQSKSAFVGTETQSRGNEARQKIMSAVAWNKAISRRMLSDQLKLSKCSVEYHTTILIDAGLITERKGGRGESIYELANA